LFLSKIHLNINEIREYSKYTLCYLENNGSHIKRVLTFYNSSSQVFDNSEGSIYEEETQRTDKSLLGQDYVSRVHPN
jgi:hypothetical protein